MIKLKTIIMTKIIENVAIFLAKQIDKLKISNPIAFVVVQMILVAVSGAIASGSIVIPTPSFIVPFISILGIETLNSLVGGVLVALIALIGSRTSKYLNK